ncbi:MAG: FtsW/RodA/SpoVE family cell cycle protein [Phycisphaerales bacterium]
MIRAGHVIALCVIALLTIGVVMVNSAVMSVARVGTTAPQVPVLTADAIILSRQTLYMLLAVAAMGVGAMLPARRMLAMLPGPFEADDLVGLAKPLAIVGGAMLLACGLVYVPGLGAEINGAHRWLRLPVPGMGDALSVQPSELAKWGLIPLVAWYCWARAGQIGEFARGLLPMLLIVGAISGFIILEDLGTGALIGGMACLLLVAGGAKVWHFLLCVPIGVLGLSAAILSSDYRRKRILAFLDPYDDPKGIGYHTVQSLISVSNGGGFGRGLGHGLQKFGYLPEDKNDFIFAVICEELGIAGAALVCGLFAMLLVAGFAVAKRERNSILRLVAFGVPAMVGFQAVFNLAVVTGLAPNKGIALPLLSAGGTGWILTAFSLGVVISIDRTRVAAAPLPVIDMHPASSEAGAPSDPGPDLTAPVHAQA